jgi:AcrR family transcriptional regulator
MGATRDDRLAADLTARARIRDAALEEFADRGVQGATVRAIAARAGVSAALVQHHFGTKEGLREACDTHVMDYLRRQTKQGLDEGGVADARYLAGLFQSAPPLLRYLSRALVDGSPGAAAVFDELVGLTERYLADREGLSDPRTRAVVFTAMRLGVTVLHEHVSRGLGADLFSAEAAPRVGRATLDIVAPELVPGDVGAQVKAGLDRLEDQRFEDQRFEDQRVERGETR